MKDKSDITVVIRVDASTNIGVGHSARCFALAESLSRQGARVHFVCREIPENYQERFRRNNHPLHMINADHNLSGEEDALATKNILLKLGKIDFLVIDHYGLGQSWEKDLRSFVSKIMVIDDLANREHDCDVLLDQALGREKQDYQAYVPEHCLLLVGPAYALLSSQYTDARFAALSKRKNKNSVKNILVSMGGADPNNVTEFIIDALESIDEDLNISVVIGPHMKNQAAFEDKTKNYPHSIRFVSDVDNLSELIAEADLAIGAGGVSSFERCCLGLPTIMIVVAENQLQNANTLAEVGAVNYLGLWHQITSTQLQTALKKYLQQPALSQAMTKSAANLCDAYGADRCAAEFFTYAANNDAVIRLRPVCREDADIMLQWQTHPSTRKYARTPKSPKNAEHIQWLAEHIDSPDSIFNIILFNEISVGVLRLDRIEQENNAFEVSIVISPDYRRQGIAASALKLCRNIFHNLEFHAEVHTDNKASHELFIAADYYQAGMGYVSKPLSS